MTSIQKFNEVLCYKKIKENYYNAVFGGEFILVIDKTTGCFNATKFCAYYGGVDKKFNDWMKLERNNSPGNFYEIRESNNDAISKQITGQYDILNPTKGYKIIF